MLGIETSCDDTGVAVVSTSGRIFSGTLACQVLAFSLILHTSLFTVIRCHLLLPRSLENRDGTGRRPRGIWRCGTELGHGSSQSCYGQLCRGRAATGWNHSTGSFSCGCVNWAGAESMPAGVPLHLSGWLCSWKQLWWGCCPCESQMCKYHDALRVLYDLLLPSLVRSDTFSAQLFSP